MNYEVLIGDCIESMQNMPEKSVHTCVTSPPYFGLRDYGMVGQIGLEDTPDAFVARLVDVFREVRRVLRDDGTLWLNLGDSYANDGKWGGSSGGKHVTALHGDTSIGRGKKQTGLKPKDLIGIPWRVAFALQADGWYLRQDIIWAKPNPMPESVKDRCTKAHEYVFLLSKSPSYFFDSYAMREPGVYPAGTKGAKGSASRQAEIGVNARPPEYKVYDGFRNRRSVWNVQTRAFKGAHFATFPPDLIEPCILAGAPEKCCAKCQSPYNRLTSRGAEQPDVEGSDLDRFGTGQSGVHRKVGGQYQKWLDANPKKTVGWEPTCGCKAEAISGTVLDPFGGSGTTAGVALKNGRNAVLCELNPAYANLIEGRVRSIAGVLPQTRLVDPVMWALLA